MKKMIFSVFFLSVFGLLVNVVYAEESTHPSKPTVGIANNESAVEPGTDLINISHRDINSNLPFVLQFDHKACMDQCSQAHTSCMSKAGGNPSAINNCDEQRWRCTLNCDDRYYGLNPFDSFNRY